MSKLRPPSWLTVAWSLFEVPVPKLRMVRYLMLTSWPSPVKALRFLCWPSIMAPGPPMQGGAATGLDLGEFIAPKDVDPGREPVGFAQPARPVSFQFCVS